jgi:hypothetical protein
MRRILIIAELVDFKAGQDMSRNPGEDFWERKGSSKGFKDRKGLLARLGGF